MGLSLDMALFLPRHVHTPTATLASFSRKVKFLDGREPSPRAMLLFLMDQQGLKPEDFADCISQSELSDVLNGDGSMSKEIAEKLAPRLHVTADWFF